MLLGKNVLEIFNINDGSFTRKSTNLTFSNLLVYPTIVDSNVYICANRDLYKFDFYSNSWNKVEVNYSNDSIIKTSTINRELVVQNSSNDILKYNGSWVYIGNVNLGTYAFEVGGYCYAYFNGVIKKYSIDKFQLIDEFQFTTRIFNI